MSSARLRNNAGIYHMDIEIIRNQQHLLLHFITKLWSTQTFKVVYMVVTMDADSSLFHFHHVCFATEQKYYYMYCQFLVRNVCGSGGQEQLSVYRGGATLGQQDELAVVCGHSEQ